MHSDPRAACFYSRRALKLGIHWLYRNDNRLKLPYQDHLSAPIHEPTLVGVVGPVVLPKLKLIKDVGNLAVHSSKPIAARDALAVVRELFHFGYWLARTDGRTARPDPGLRSLELPLASICAALAGLLESMRDAALRHDLSCAPLAP